MKHRRPLSRLLLPLALCAALVLTAAAVQGGKDDPLVTLSYLTEKFLPQLLTQAEEKAVDREKALETKLQGVADKYAADMERRINKALSGGGSGGAAGFVTLSLTAGERVTLAAGSELLFRSGTAKCAAPDAPGLVDTTTGETVDNGKALTANHLYLATAGGRGLLADGPVTVLVRGTYLRE